MDSTWGRAAAGLAALLCGLLTGCTVAVAGSGHVGGPLAGPSLPPVPSQSPSATPPRGPLPGPVQVDCPRVVDPAVRLRFRCVTSAIRSVTDPIWTLNLIKPVEPGWVLGEGATGLTATSAISLRRIVTVLRAEMVALGSWGPDPGIRTLTDRATTVAGVPAQVLATEFTIDPAFRTQRKLTVRTERTWIVALRVDATHVALWYVTLPDLVEKLWPTVPGLIRSIELD